MNLVSKYNIPAPRYTSYPTVPYWDNNLVEEQWITQVRRSFIRYGDEGISLYIHLPFCESLCTYCACNTRITVNHAVEQPYIAALLKEWKMYLQLFGKKPLLKELHLGGGTPTFFSAAHLYYLLRTLFETCDIAHDASFSFEGHPGNTSIEHLQVLSELRFRRVSFGVQDFDETVQEAINRYQSYEEVKQVIAATRLCGYRSVNIDLVYGLPHQTPETVGDTIRKVISLKPERIAFYSYAHVPWLKPGQRRYSETDLPTDIEKRMLYTLGRELMLEAGYSDIGMDHFALPGDELCKAAESGRLHRNFMGYTERPTNLLIGLGCSAISDAWMAFSQNIKTVEEYQQAVNEGHFPIQRGHVLTREDLLIRQHILNLMCRYESDFNITFCNEAFFEKIKHRLDELVEDRLVSIHDKRIRITEQGRLFLRNICLAFDNRYHSRQQATNVFSTTA
jgi:oxygen-independent coproporphyrinogen-3 oxidase